MTAVSSRQPDRGRRRWIGRLGRRRALGSRGSALRHATVHLVSAYRSDSRQRAQYVLSSWMAPQEEHSAAAEALVAAAMELARRSLPPGRLMAELSERAARPGIARPGSGRRAARPGNDPADAPARTAAAGHGAGGARLPAARTLPRRGRPSGRQAHTVGRRIPNGFRGSGRYHLHRHSAMAREPMPAVLLSCVDDPSIGAKRNGVLPTHSHRREGETSFAASRETLLSLLLGRRLEPCRVLAATSAGTHPCSYPSRRDVELSFPQGR